MLETRQFPWGTMHLPEPVDVVADLPAQQRRFAAFELAFDQTRGYLLAAQPVTLKLDATLLTVRSRV